MGKLDLSNIPALRPSAITTVRAPLQFEYDPRLDVITIEGVNYAGDMFRCLAAPRTDRLYQFKRDGINVWVTDRGPAPENGTK